MNLKVLVKRARKLSVSDISLKLSEKKYHKRQKKRAFPKSYIFDDRSRGSKNFLIVLAGFQDYYWSAVLERVRANELQFDEDIDICVCVPLGGENADKLRGICEKMDWSYLKLPEDLLAQTQNIAIKLHEKAEWIFKIDEDIILSDNYFASMKKSWADFEKTSYMRVGILAPLLNVNAYASRRFLISLGKLDEYEAKYGKYDLCEDWINADIHSSPDTALYLWENSLPFDGVSKKIAEINSGVVTVCPHRFSIGAILMKRSYWEKMGMFTVGVTGELGLEEKQVCEFCMNDMHAIAVAESVFAGHLGFYKQKAKVHEFFDKNVRQIRKANNEYGF